MKSWYYTLVLVSVVACGANNPEESSAGNAPPATPEEAAAEAERLDQLIAENPGDPELLAQGRTLELQTEELSGLVTRIELSPEHWVAFFVEDDGSITVSERLLQGGGESPIMADPELSTLTPAELHEHLEPDLEVPDVLKQTIASEAEAPLLGEEGVGGGSEAELLAGNVAEVEGEFGTASQALTAADGPWFSANACPTGGFQFCLPNHANGFWSQFNTRYSQMWLAPFSGALVSAVRYRNGAFLSSLPVFSGELRLFQNNGVNNAVATLRFEVQNASGDNFHVSTNHWN